MNTSRWNDRTNVQAFSFCKTCRLCLQPLKGFKYKIFSKKYQQLSTNIAICLSLELSKCDRLPHLICKVCFQQVHNFAQFRKNSQKSDEILRCSVNLDVVPDFLQKNCNFVRKEKTNNVVKSKYKTKPINSHRKNQQKPKDSGKIVSKQSFSNEQANINSFNYLVSDVKQTNYFDNVLENALNNKGDFFQNYSKIEETQDDKETVLDDLFDSTILSDRVPDVTNIYQFQPLEPSEDNLDCDIKETIKYLITLERQDMIKDAAICSYSCETCLAWFPCFLDFLDHQNDHEGSPLFTCDKCSQVFYKKMDLVRHESQHPISCPVCGKQVLPISYKNHFTSHTDKYKCQKCGVCTGNKKQLESHDFLVHNEIREHVCESCGKRFKSKSGLTTHNKSHSEERAYPCKLCNYAGRTASGLYTHMTLHSDEKIACDICAKIFMSRRRLNDHKWRIHNTKMKHQCSFCFKKFAQKYKLIVHTRVHTGDRPYVCGFCNRTFSRQEVWKTHVNKCTFLRLGDAHNLIHNQEIIAESQIIPHNGIFNTNESPSDVYKSLESKSNLQTDVFKTINSEENVANDIFKHPQTQPMYQNEIFTTNSETIVKSNNFKIDTCLSVNENDIFKQSKSQSVSEGLFRVIKQPFDTVAAFKSEKINYINRNTILKTSNAQKIDLESSFKNLNPQVIDENATFKTIIDQNDTFKLEQPQSVIKNTDLRKIVHEQTILQNSIFKVSQSHSIAPSNIFKTINKHQDRNSLKLNESDFKSNSSVKFTDSNALFHSSFKTTNANSLTIENSADQNNLYKATQTQSVLKSTQSTSFETTEANIILQNGTYKNDEELNNTSMRTVIRSDQTVKS